MCTTASGLTHSATRAGCNVGCISRICSEAACRLICTKFVVLVGVADAISCDKLLVTNFLVIGKRGRFCADLGRGRKLHKFAIYKASRSGSVQLNCVCQVMRQDQKDTFHRWLLAVTSSVRTFTSKQEPAFICTEVYTHDTM